MIEDSGVPLEPIQELFTYADVQNWRCRAADIGKPRLLRYDQMGYELDIRGKRIPDSPRLFIPEQLGSNTRRTESTTDTAIGDVPDMWLKAFDKLGGVDALVEFGESNPTQFYGQVVKLFGALNSKQTLNVERTLSGYSREELNKMSSAELKALILKDTQE